MGKSIRVERRRKTSESDGPRPDRQRKIILPAGWKRDFWCKDAGYRPAVRAGLILQESESGLVVSDPENAKRFLLADIDCRVFLQANGRRSAAQVLEALQAQTPARGPITEEAVNRSLVKLIE